MEDTGLRVSGSILLYRLYDVAGDINLVRVEEKVRDHKRQGIDRKRFSKAFEFVNPPLSLTLKTFERDLKGQLLTINVYAKAYDYGVLSSIFEIPVKEVEITELQTITGNLEELLKEDFQKVLNRLVDDLGDALHQVTLSRFEEDYTVYYLRQLHPEKTARDLIRLCDIGGLLLYEAGERPPSPGTKEDLLSFSFSYSESDLVVLAGIRRSSLSPIG